MTLFARNDLPEPRVLARSRVGGFVRGEDGTVITFALTILVLMLMAGGLAIDLMRHEGERSRVQNTADTATLAAASLRQDLDPEAVVTNYFALAGLSGNLTGVVVDEGLNYRNVRAQTRTSVDTIFMRMMGIDNITSRAGGGAEERITNVEIVLVLDISGSMGSNSRIANLKHAADEFVEKLLQDDQDNRISISIVPYNGQVNVGPALFSRFNVTHTHDANNNNWPCIDLPSSVYSSIPMSRTLGMPQSGNVDTYSTTSRTNGYVNTQGPSSGNIWCNPKTANRVTVHSNNMAVLRSQIANLSAVGATSIDAGVKWGAMLLDPAMRPLTADLANANIVPQHFANRPFEYNDPETLKVLVVMSDGEHFAEQRLDDDYRVGLSPIYRAGDGNYSIHHPSHSGSNKYYVPHRSGWRSSAWSSSGVTQLTWPQVWSNLRMQWVAWQLYARPLGGSNSTNRTNRFNEAMNNFRIVTPTGTMNTRLNSHCTLAKQNGVLVYTIAFEAPNNGRIALNNCASPGQYYDVQGLEIGTAFRTIRSQISKLRLVQ